MLKASTPTLLSVFRLQPGEQELAGWTLARRSWLNPRNEASQSQAVPCSQWGELVGEPASLFLYTIRPTNQGNGA